MTVEAGHAGTTETDDIELLANGCFNVMRFLKMLPGSVTPVENPVWIERVENVTSDQTGIFYPLVRRGTFVARDEDRVRDGLRRTNHPRSSCFPPRAS